MNWGDVVVNQLPIVLWTFIFFVIGYLPENSDFETYTSHVSPVALVPPQLLGLWRAMESIALKFPR